MSGATPRDPDRPARVLIVDDHPIVREGLGVLIARHGDLAVCGEAAGVAEALRLVDAAAPDVAVIDIALGEGDGLDLVRRIRARAAAVRMLVCSMYPESLYAERALRAGAMGYINKQEPAGQIIAAVRAVLAGRIYLSGAMAERLLRQSVGGRPAADRSPYEALTDRELEVFRLIGAGRTTAQIAAQLHRSIHTIETYRQRIKAKLALQTAAELARAAAHWVLENG